MWCISIFSTYYLLIGALIILIIFCLAIYNFSKLNIKEGFGPDSCKLRRGRPRPPPDLTGCYQITASDGDWFKARADTAPIAGDWNSWTKETCLDTHQLEGGRWCGDSIPQPDPANIVTYNGKQYATVYSAPQSDGCRKYRVAVLLSLF